MGFQFQVRLSPWGQESLYRAMARSGGKMSFKRFLIDTVVESTEDPELRERAIEIAKVMVTERTGKAWNT